MCLPHTTQNGSALAYILGHEGVWCTTGGEIIEYYLAAGATFCALKLSTSISTLSSSV
jgi:hypothetical protein